MVLLSALAHGDSSPWCCHVVYSCFSVILTPNKTLSEAQNSAIVYMLLNHLIRSAPKPLIFSLTFLIGWQMHFMRISRFTRQSLWPFWLILLQRQRLNIFFYWLDPFIFVLNLLGFRHICLFSFCNNCNSNLSATPRHIYSIIIMVMVFIIFLVFCFYTFSVWKDPESLLNHWN